jgi:copper chaperone
VTEHEESCVKTVLATVMGLVLTFSAAQTAGGDDHKVKILTCTLKVSGMTCAGCEVAVRLAARSVDGVQDVTVSYAKGRAEVTYAPAKTSPAAVATAITKKSGFTAEPVPPPGQKPAVKGD